MSETRAETEHDEAATEEAKLEGGDVAPSLAGRLAGVGEETVKRLYDELGKNERAKEAFKGARDQFERISRSALQQLGIAPLDELNDLRAQVGRLEARVRVLEGNGEESAASGREPEDAEAGKG